MHYDIVIKKNVVTVQCEVSDEDFKKVPLVYYHGRAHGIVCAVVDTIGFCFGVGFTVIFETHTRPNGQTAMLAKRNPELARHITFPIETSADIAALYLLTVKKPTFHQILRDLNEALSHQRLMHINCARAIEGIRRMIAPDAKDRQKAWIEFDSKLQLARSYRQLILDSSTERRHGDAGFQVPVQTQHEVLVRSWTIMNRYIEYVRRGGVDQLPLSEFQLLS